MKALRVIHTLRLPVIVSVLLVGAICANALLLQSGRHPAPLFATGPKAKAPATGGGAQAALDPDAPFDTLPQPQHMKMVAELQQTLFGLGFYSGPVDGIYGPVTRAGLVAYQQAHALPATGIATRRLLDHAMLRGREMPVPVPPDTPRSAGKSSEGGPRG